MPVQLADTANPTPYPKPYLHPKKNAENGSNIYYVHQQWFKNEIICQGEWIDGVCLLVEHKDEHQMPNVQTSNSIVMFQTKKPSTKSLTRVAGWRRRGLLHNKYKWALGPISIRWIWYINLFLLSQIAKLQSPAQAEKKDGFWFWNFRAREFGLKIGAKQWLLIKLAGIGKTEQQFNTRSYDEKCSYGDRVACGP